MDNFRYDLTGNGYYDLRFLFQKQQEEKIGVSFNLEDATKNQSNEIFIVG
jgi:hypothetical protein